VRASMLDPYKGLVGEILKDHPRLLATRMFGMLRDRGYPGSVVQLRRYVKTVRPQRAEAYLRLQTLPGEQAQVDWGHFGPIRVGPTVRSLSGFVLVLSWSRACYARFALDQTLESFLRGHVEAFTALQGVPRTILYDNLKSVVLERVGDHIRFHPRLLDTRGPRPVEIAHRRESPDAGAGEPPLETTARALLLFALDEVLDQQSHDTLLECHVGFGMSPEGRHVFREGSSDARSIAAACVGTASAASRCSSSATRSSAAFQRRSRVSTTRRCSGSTASYCRCARSVS